MEQNHLISEQFRIIAKRWVEADAAANLREESKSAVLARLMVAMGDMPVSRAEMSVKASEEWTNYINEMVAARKDAASLKVQLEYIRMRFHEWQSHEATKRAEMKL